MNGDFFQLITQSVLKNNAPNFGQLLLANEFHPKVIKNTIFLEHMYPSHLGSMFQKFFLMIVALALSNKEHSFVRQIPILYVKIVFITLNLYDT